MHVELGGYWITGAHAEGEWGLGIMHVAEGTGIWFQKYLKGQRLKTKIR